MKAITFYMYQVIIVGFFKKNKIRNSIMIAEKFCLKSK